MYRIEADLMIPGRGEPVRDAVVTLDGPRIEYAGPAGSAPEATTGAIKVAVVMPGMWDCHAHFIGVRSLDLSVIAHMPIAVRAARATADLRTALDAGITSVREVGGLGLYLTRVIEEGVLDGPAI